VVGGGWRGVGGVGGRGYAGCRVDGIEGSGRGLCAGWVLPCLLLRLEVGVFGVGVGAGSFVLQAGASSGHVRRE
jgi:hypothetical protein